MTDNANFADTYDGTGNPYKIVDHTREKRKGVTATSFRELIDIARSRFCISPDAEVTVVLEQDGTEIDDEEYFATLDRNTSLMILVDDQKWKPPGRSKSPSHYLVVDDTDSSNKKIVSVDKKSCHLNIGTLLTSLHNEPSQISLLSGSELEKLSDMDPESLGDIITDRMFLEQLKEASGRFLAEKRQAQESMSLLRMFATSGELEQT